MTVFTIQLSPIENLKPYLVGTGDDDFWGYGPKVTLKTELQIHNDNLLYAYVFFRAKEQGGDRTEAEGRFYVPINEASGILNKVGANSTLLFKDSGTNTLESKTVSNTLQGQGEKIISVSGEDFVNHYEVVGDSIGPDVGFQTKTSVYFNPIEISTSDVSRNPVRTIFLLDKGISCTPKHTGQGDRDFYGYGPSITTGCRIYVHPDRKQEIWYEIFMRAIETRGDRTEAEASEKALLYRHEKPIDRIISATTSRHSYTDINIRIDTHIPNRDDLVNRYVLVGDTRGNDIGETKVTAYLNPIKIREES